MKVPVNWLKDYVDIEGIDTKTLINALTLSGSKVEGVEELGHGICNVVVGKIISLEKHPDADKLQVAKVDVGAETIQVVTGADNVKVGDIIPVAKDGAKLPGGKEIRKGKLRGVESEGMMCSIQELGVTKYDYPEAPEHGIFILDSSLKVGTDVKDALGLNDSVIEFEITPNRPDCLSVIGIARETAVTLGRNFKAQGIIDKKSADGVSEASDGEISVRIDDKDLCSRYIGRVVNNVKIGPSPEWMKNKLRAAGIRPINNIVDITNFVMLELGQPMHAFDLRQVEGKQIIVRRAQKGEVLTTLDGQERSLTADMLVIADKSRAVAVAGVMGGGNSEIADDTTDILFEAAAFNGGSVRLTAKALGFRTESSARFEKGLDAGNALIAMNRAVELVEMLGAGKAKDKYVDCYPVKQELKTLKFRPEKINAFLGTNLEKEYMVEKFKLLGFTVDENNSTITAPAFRRDIEVEADLAEEIARLYDYNNIESKMFSGTVTQGKRTLKQKVEETCKQVMTAQGFSEMYTYSFVSPKTLDMIKVEGDSKLREAIIVANPLGEEYKMMRTTPIPSMLEVLARNYSRRIPEARLFELSCIYIPKQLPVTELPNEKQLLTFGMYGNEDFYTIKGAVEQILDCLGIKDYEIIKGNNCTFHPGRTAELIIAGTSAGVFGEIHPDVLDNYDIKTRAYVGTIELESLIEKVNTLHIYRQLPKYPSIDRDIAMVVKDQITVGEIEKQIKSAAGELLEELRMFDVYKGEQIAKDSKSIAYALSFRAGDRTLTDDEVNAVMQNILKGLKENIGAELR
ncbi:MAG: phenylalanine--tRNA ligase subunit beta [Deltaproteobacteria bacterium]